MATSQKKSLIERMAEAEEEHRRQMEEKDRAFKAAMEAIDKQFNSHKDKEDQRWNTLDETKAELRESFKNSGLREEKRIKEERLREVERHTASSELKERLTSTWYNLELQSNAHELDQWCVECGCIHTSDIVNEAEETDCQ